MAKAGEGERMRVYLASRYSRRVEMLGYAAELATLGHEVVSTWVDGRHETRPDIDNTGTSDERGVWAEEDLRDIRRADCLIFFEDAPGVGGRARGGKYVELGYFAGWRDACRAANVIRSLFVVGPREGGNVFLHLPSVQWYPDWQACLSVLAPTAEEHKA